MKSESEKKENNIHFCFKLEWRRHLKVTKKKKSGNAYTLVTTPQKSDEVKKKISGLVSN